MVLPSSSSVQVATSRCSSTSTFSRPFTTGRSAAAPTKRRRTNRNRRHKVKSQNRKMMFIQSARETIEAYRAENAQLMAEQTPLSMPQRPRE